MKLKAAFLPATVSAFVLLAACGGGGGDNSSASGNSGSGSSSGSGGGTGCQPQTVVGGDLFVAQQAPVGVTLLSTGGFSQSTFTFLYDSVFGIPANNPQ